MKILNVCSLLPLDGLKRENDVQIKIQREIQNIDKGIDFVFLKELPYSNHLLGIASKKWAQYHEYIARREIIVGGYRTYIFPWLRLPTSNFKVNKALLPINTLWNLPKAETAINSEISTFNLILSQNNISDGYIARYLSEKFNIPHIHTLRGEIDETMYNSPHTNAILNSASVCITPSPTMFRYMKGRRKETIFMPHGIDEEYFYTDTKYNSKIKFITVSRLLDWKNIDLAIKSFRPIRDYGCDFEYNIVGDGPERQKLESLVRKLGLQDNIHFAGWQQKEMVIKSLQASNVMIMPSYPETFGRAFVEAAATGCLIIGHKGSGVDGLFQHGKSALFCDKTDIVETVGSLVRDFENRKYISMRDEAYDIVTEMKWETIAQNYIELFHNIVSQHN